MKFRLPPVSNCSFPHPRVCRARVAGFTLLELLVVIAIITVLAGLTYAAFGRLRQVAGAAKCQSHLRQWGMAYQNYVNDNDGATPQSAEVAGDSNTQWQELIARYLVGTKGTETRRFEMRTQFRCPGDKNQGGIVYGGLHYLKPTQYNKAPTKLINLEQPMRYMLMAENYTGELWDARPWDGRQGVDYGRHGTNGTANFLFADFHIEALTYNDTLKMPVQFVP